MRELSGEDFAFLARLLHRRSGLVLTPDRSGLFARRMQPVMRRFGFKDMAAMVRELRLGDRALAAAAVEAMTVNDTGFFRDRDVFAHLEREVLPALVAARAGTRRLRIWCSACAAGQEAYSIAMILDAMGLKGWIIDLIATDLSGEMIARAEKGVYSAFEVERIDPAWKEACFVPAPDGGLRLAERLRRMVTFQHFNLLDSFGWLDELDMVLCRNVLIYFDGVTKSSVLDRIADTLCEDGVLVLGQAESPRPFTAAFEAMDGGQGLYAKAKAVPQRLSAAV